MGQTRQHFSDTAPDECRRFASRDRAVKTAKLIIFTKTRGVNFFFQPGKSGGQTSFLWSGAKGCAGFFQAGVKAQGAIDTAGMVCYHAKLSAGRAFGFRRALHRR